MKWKHCRKGIIEGEIVREAGDWVDIKLANKVHVGHGDPICGTGFRDVHASPGEVICVRKSFLTEIPERKPNVSHCCGAPLRPEYSGLNSTHYYCTQCGQRQD